MLKKLIKSETAFSYVEILLAIVILGLIFNSALFIYERGFFYWDKGEKEIDLQQNLRITLDKVSKDLRKALPDSIMVKDSDGFEIVNYNVARPEGILQLGDQIEFQTKTPPSTSTSGYVYETITFKKTDEGLSRKVKTVYYDAQGAVTDSKPGSFQPLAKYITQVSFNYTEKVADLLLHGENLAKSATMKTNVYFRIEQ